MKRIILLATVFAASLNFAGCSSDDDSNSVVAVTPEQEQEPTYTELQGKWNLYQQGIIVGNEAVYQDITPEPGCEYDYVTFEDPITFTRATHDLNAANACEATIVTGTWVRDGRNLTVTEGETATTYYIRRLGSDRLSVHVVNNETPIRAYHFVKDND